MRTGVKYLIERMENATSTYELSACEYELELRAKEFTRAEYAELLSALIVSEILLEEREALS